MNAQDAAIVNELIKTWHGANEANRRELVRINDNALTELYNSRESLLLQVESNQRAIDMRVAFGSGIECYPSVTHEDPT